MAETAAEYDLIYQKTPPYQVLQTPWLSFEEMAKVMDVEYAVDHYYNEEYFKTALQRATTLWQQQGRAVFDFYLALSNYDRQQAGQKSLTQRAEILYQFLSREWPEHTLFWRYSIRLDFIRRGIALPVSLHEKQELDLWKQYQERIAICFPALQEIPKRLWRKQISLFALPVAVAQYTPGVYAANFLQREGIWQQAKILKIAD